MRRVLTSLSAAFIVLALAEVAFLLLSDLGNLLRPDPSHFRTGALALIFAGISFLCLQCAAGLRFREMLKGLLLGAAFVAWGGEQFLPPGPLVVAADGLVITIFIVDLGLVIIPRLRAASRRPPPL